MARYPHASLLFFAPLHALGLTDGFSSLSPPALVPVFPFPAHASSMRPRSSAKVQSRNLHLLSIGYASRPRLRPRLTQGRSALPWNPWIFGQEDSHLFLATHSGILSSHPSTAPSGTASSVCQCSSTEPSTLRITRRISSVYGDSSPAIRRIDDSLSFGVVFQPRTFSAQDLSASELLRTL